MISTSAVMLFLPQKSSISCVSAIPPMREPEIIFVDKKPRNNGKPLFGTRNLSEVYLND
jgi:hypothetical protein